MSHAIDILRLVNIQVVSLPDNLKGLDTYGIKLQLSLRHGSFFKWLQGKGKDSYPIMQGI